MTPEPHEPELADFIVVAAHELRHGDILLDLGSELSGRITMLRSIDLSEPGDHGMAEISVDLAWRGETLTRTTIVADMLDLRVIAVRP
ncbi:hypothetical protein [Gordonia malaquae]|uniref:Uncharacterized protein n=1 Tax=Gordonia malaquae NBRC 108250 TaxID=1223542 RepID=M3UHF2_GORML|nr:hypothetical protein [Gordonia malaquae]GAC78780.1 hypothetical protein GM1_004_02250 [Gordonia malaquae NBRC 108250]